MMIRFFYSLFPLGLALLGAVLHNIPLMAATVPLLFLMVRFLPFCRRRENLWMFVFAAISLPPVNVCLLRAFDIPDLADGSRLHTVFLFMLGFVLLLSLEELILAVLTRLIWRRQYKLPEIEEDDDDF